MRSHPQALRSFAQRLDRLLLLRVVVQQMTLWFFIWGVFVLAMKFSRAPHPEWLALGVFGFIPVACVVALRERRRRPAFEKLRANYDRLNACGGVIMSEETADMSAWLSHLLAQRARAVFSLRRGVVCGDGAAAAGALGGVWQKPRAGDRPVGRAVANGSADARAGKNSAGAKGGRFAKAVVAA
jgi:hypothetical protein